MNNLISRYNFSQSDIAKYRKRVINFHAKHGSGATIDVFGIFKKKHIQLKEETEKITWQS